MDRSRGASPVNQSPLFLGPPVDPQGRIVKRPLRFGAAKALHELRDQYRFFTPAALYLHGQFQDTFLIDYMFELGEDVPLAYHRFNVPLFAGLETAHGDRDWNHVLWAVPLPYWETLSDFLCSLTVSCRDTAAVLRYGEQRFFVADPLAADVAVVLRPGAPLVAISAFGIYGNRGIAAFQRGPTVYDRHRFMRRPADPADVAYATAHLAGANPIEARAQFLQQIKDEFREDPD